MAIGDPHTRPEVETIFVSNSFHLEHDAQEWEACTLVLWALHLPPGAGARDIAGLIIIELHLRPGDVAVMLHQPEPYLVHFNSAAHAAEACHHGRFTGGGINICLRPWHSLTHALSFRIFYRVCLCLDGIPSHAWTPEIVERVIGHKCALQHIVTDLIQLADSMHIELWAWMADPSEIPKKVWLAFMHSPATKSSTFSVSAEPPSTYWQQGTRYEVFIHMPLLEDYTAAACNLQQAWNHDDGGDRNPGDHGRGRSSAYGATGARCGAPGEGDADDGGRGRGRHARQEDRDRAKHRAARQTCNHDFVWPPRRGDDDDDDHRDYDHSGHGRKYGDAYWGCTEVVHRDRTRRSAWLAKKPSIPVAEKAQRYLWRKLGISNDEMAPIDEILRDFLSMFRGPLPENVVAAMRPSLTSMTKERTC
uniref:DUF4283 domain-containing protein n=1 Tax=Setaria viridis TaxID=4556 RepID=A0A4U6UYS4_SETVI|nr:hypothetical protein SEVIR_4G094900v2 [Setaria viridis]